MADLYEEKDLGEVLCPWEFSSDTEHIEIGNSLKALQTFRKHFGKGDSVGLVLITLADDDEKQIMAWHFVCMFEGKQASVLLPVFDLDDVDKLNCSIIKKVQVITSEMYYYLRRKLYAVVYTDKGNLVVKKVRSVLTEVDMHNILKLRGTEYTDLYPVDIYSHEKKKFVGACWAIENMSNERGITYFEPICRDENEKLCSLDISDVEPFPIELNGEIEIGGDLFILRYKNNFGKYFEKVERQENKVESTLKAEHPNANVFPIISFDNVRKKRQALSVQLLNSGNTQDAKQKTKGKILKLNLKKWR